MATRARGVVDGMVSVAFLAVVLVGARGAETPQAAEIKAGDTVKVTTGPAPVKLGTETLITVGAGTELKVLKVQGDWLQVTVEKDGKPITGWIHKRNLAPAATGGPAADTPFTNSIGMQFVRIPAGEFLMGTTEADLRAILARFPEEKREAYSHEMPAHKVRITKAFLMGKHEVTVGQFRKFVEATGYKTDAETGGGPGLRVGAAVVEPTPPGEPRISLKSDASWRKPYFEQTDVHPVVCVTWNDAKKFADWLNASDKSRPAGWAYRLPTEAEWEYAARGPKSLVFPWGNEWDGKRCNFAGKGTGLPWDDKAVADGFPRTAPVGSFSPKGDSPFGVCDMAGNVGEWCEDWFVAHASGEQTDPMGPASGEQRSVRGASWNFSLLALRCACRAGLLPGSKANIVGFRVVLAPGPPAELTNSLGMQFVRVPAGEFQMGIEEASVQAAQKKKPNFNRESFASAMPGHKVRLTTAFLMGKHEVTVGQFRKFVEATGYKTNAETGGGGLIGALVIEPKISLKSDASWRKPYFEQTDAHPVVCVSWNDAKKFAEWLNASDKSKPAGWAYRLPTDAEWEYAARGPMGLFLPWGFESDGKCSNSAAKGTGLPNEDKAIADGFPRTAPVGSFSPKGDSPFGVCDMAGNVEEWCEDWYGAYTNGEQTDPTGPASGKDRVVRGGSWAHPWWHQDSFLRLFPHPADYRANDTGFRVVLAPGPQ